MTRFKKIALIILGVLLLPFVILAINRIAGLFYDHGYAAIDKTPASVHYLLQKVQAKGTLMAQTAYSNEIDSTWVDTLALTKTGEIDTSQKPQKVYKTYSGKIYLDTIKHTLKAETAVRLPGKEEDEQGADQNYFYTINTKGKVIGISKDSSGFFKNCLLLQDKIQTYQPWLDSDQPVYISHFTKETFNPGCLNPLRNWGNPNGNTLCYTWEGTAYFKLNFHLEAIKFKVPCASEAVLFSSDNDYMTVIEYYEVPQRFKNKFDVAFIVYDDMVYLARAK